MATLTLTKKPALSLAKLPYPVSAQGLERMGLDYPMDGDTLYSSELYTLALKYRAQDAIASTPELLAEARGWLTDCFSADGEGWGHVSAESIAARISRHYDGGAIAFYLASRTLAPTITRTN